MNRLSNNPPARYPFDRPIEAEEGNWVVAHLKSRQEKAFAGDLFQAGISYYMPLLEKRSRRRDNGKIRKSIVPLFPGYVAVAIPEKGWNILYDRQRVANLIPVIDQHEFTQELCQVYRVLESSQKVDLAPIFSDGQPVRVKEGPMMGLEGVVKEYRGESMFLIRVSMFHQSVRLEIEDSYLEAIS